MSRLSQKVISLRGVAQAKLKRSQPVDEQEDEVAEITYTLHLNSPVGEWVKQKTVEVVGWLLPDGEATVQAMRVVNNGVYHELEYGIARHDVVKAYGELPSSKTLNTGFSGSFEYEEGTLQIEADFGAGWVAVRNSSIHYSPEDLVAMTLNSNLSENVAEHQNLLANKKVYYYEKASDAEFQRTPTDPRLVAFYLPQFHPIKENDIAWGKGFTEWRNVANAQPRFVGHQQPFIPTDLGYYDLRLADTIHDQISLAKKYGVYGFCFYYYWFSGKRLLHTPLDIFLEHKEWDFNFMIAWANENWTKRWDGLDNDVIVAQQYLKSDPLQFIKDVEHILLDPRYITEDGKPVLIVYRGMRLKDPARYIKVWREYFKEQHNKELHIVFVLGLDLDDMRPMGFDKGLEFEPLTIAKRTNFSEVWPRPPQLDGKLLDAQFEGGVADYRQVALSDDIGTTFDFDTYKSVMPSWDNDARKKGKGPTVFYGSNPDLYAKWLDRTITHEKQKTESPLVFVNAWNEWAEGTVLEPTGHNGHALLNRTAEVLAKHSSNAENVSNFPLYNLQKRRKSVKIAVIVHVFYEKEWQYIAQKIQTALPDTEYDLFITLPARSLSLEERIKENFAGVTIVHVPNRGRDILPFMHLMPRLRDLGYEYVLKLHTKRSTHRINGEAWFRELIDSLLPNTASVEKIVKKLEDGTAIVGPRGHFVSLSTYLGSNQVALQNMLTQINGSEEAVAQIMQRLDEYGYFAGSMFWLNVQAIDQLIDLYPIVEDFESEKGQIDGTYAHAFERIISLIMQLNKMQIVSSNPRGTLRLIKPEDVTSEYPYA